VLGLGYWARPAFRHRRFYVFLPSQIEPTFTLWLSMGSSMFFKLYCDECLGTHNLAYAILETRSFTSHVVTHNNVNLPFSFLQAWRHLWTTRSISRCSLLYIRLLHSKWIRPIL